MCGFMVVLLAAAIVSPRGSSDVAASPLQWSSSLGDHMVLQQAPKASAVWGYAPAGSKVTVSVASTSQLLFATTEVASSTGSFRALLPPQPSSPAGKAAHPIPHTITAALEGVAGAASASTITLVDVLFGEIWVCGGQSNMQFSVGNASNATAEIAAANHFPAIRLFTAPRHYNATAEMSPQSSFSANPSQPWSVASAASIGGPWGTNFSAACWFHGRDLHVAHGFPVGLVSVNWGATDVSTWMPAAAYASCNATAPAERNIGASRMNEDLAHRAISAPSAGGAACGRIGAPCTQSSPASGRSPQCCSGRCFYYGRGPNWVLPKGAGAVGGWCDEESPSNRPSGLFNQMISPLLPMTIAGAVWYQGESDAMSGHTVRSLYNCRFEAMIAAWRSEWHAATHGQTDSAFPFGFVQISSWEAPTPDATKADDHWAVVRAAQSEALQLPNTFMAVAIDLGAFMGGCCGGLNDCDTFPNLCIHPQWKQEVGRRLSLGARALAYGEKDLCWRGPTAKAATFLTRLPSAPEPSSASDANAPKLAGSGGAPAVVVHFDVCTSSASEFLPPKLSIRNTTDFDVQLADSAGKLAWVQATIVSATADAVTVQPKPAATAAVFGKGAANAGSYLAAVAVRYLWSQSPCAHPHIVGGPQLQGNCSVYDANNLPAPPFMLNVSAA